MENWQKDSAADKPRTTEVTSPVNDLQADSQATERPADERPNVAPPTKRPFMTVRQLVITGLLGGITALLGLTGYGFIHLIYMKATILHIPTIIGGIVEGPRVGMMTGLIFGCFSLFQNIVAPTLMSIVFLNPLISVLPRVLLGLIAYLVYRAMPGAQAVKIAVSALVTSMMNTIMVMGLTYILYAKEFAEMRHVPLDQVVNIIIGICIANGIPEAIGAAVIVTPIVLVLLKTRKPNRRQV